MKKKLTLNSLFNLSIFLWDFISSMPTIKTKLKYMASNTLDSTSVEHPPAMPMSTIL